MYLICFDDKTGNCVAYAVDKHFHNVGEGKDDVVLEKGVVAPQDVILATKILQKYHSSRSSKGFNMRARSIDEAQKTWELLKNTFLIEHTSHDLHLQSFAFKTNSTYRNTNVGFVEFNMQLEQLKLKAGELAQRGYKNESSLANKIVAQLLEYKTKYLTHTMTIEELQTAANHYISSNREILDKHRGCKEILVNLLAAVCSLFVPYLIAAAIKGNLMVFHPDTDSRDKLNKIDKSLDNLDNPVLSVSY